MPQLIAQHSFFAICLIITLEEANVPLPIPGDLLLVYAGALAGHSLSTFCLWLLALTLFPTLGSFALFEVVRRGGRPLVERFGRYIHFGPKELAQSQGLLKRYGVWGIAIGRSIPIVRHAVTIACGVLETTRRDYLIGQLIGGFVNALVPMLLGALVGPSALEALHVPRLAIRLAEMLVVAVGLPALLWWLCLRIRPQDTVATNRRALVWPTLLASAAGMASMAATWAAAAAVTDLFGQERELNLTLNVAHWLAGRGFRPGGAYVIIVVGLLVGAAVLGLVYDLALRPQAASKSRVLVRQTLVLAALGCAILAALLGFGLVAPRNGPLLAWWRTGGFGITLTLALGMLSYAATTVCGHSLAVAIGRGHRPWRKQSNEPNT